MQLELWDTHGAERFEVTMAPMYYRAARGVVLVYDIANRSSFDGAAKWMASLRGEHACHLADDVRMVLVGNKSDLSSQGKRAVTEREGRSCIPSWDFECKLTRWMD
jgi:GTPase SAR1 family protein